MPDLIYDSWRDTPQARLDAAQLDNKCLEDETNTLRVMYQRLQSENAALKRQLGKALDVVEASRSWRNCPGIDQADELANAIDEFDSL